MTNKEIAQHFLRLCAKGDSRQAFERYTGKEFMHHNPYFKGDSETLMIAMEEEANRNPTKIFDIHQVIEDNDLVAVHSHLREHSEDIGLAVVHILRFQEGKIAEFWDIAQAVPGEMINENGMF